jgi:hypothetical protein
MTHKNSILELILTEEHRYRTNAYQCKKKQTVPCDDTYPRIRPSVGVKIDGKRMFIQKIIKLSKQCITLCSFIDISLNCV